MRPQNFPALDFPVLEQPTQSIYCLGGYLFAARPHPVDDY